VDRSVARKILTARGEPYNQNAAHAQLTTDGAESRDATRASAALGLRVTHRLESGGDSNAAAFITPSAVRHFIRQDSNSLWLATQCSFEQPMRSGPSSFAIARRRGWCHRGFWILPPHTPASIHPFDKAEDRLFTATFALMYGPTGPSRPVVRLPAPLDTLTTCLVRQDSATDSQCFSFHTPNRTRNRISFGCASDVGRARILTPVRGRASFVKCAFGAHNGE
jgi:hypothetical protein